ncbi:hypothetical protein [Candidatus Protofrankia californiensis]|uniref:hypothetical protein n=1 Tax=Candidatus Protofrankia californiensis TaxID=1839754 RepID=UPI001041B0C7|nr:hypothetical protein [Candidatus Protofrankia californiensis]
MLRQIVDHLGVDPDNNAALIDLAAVTVTRMAWRDGPVEDWHAGPESQLGDAEMMRANAATTPGARPSGHVVRQDSWHRGLLALSPRRSVMSRPSLFHAEDKIRIVLPADQDAGR